MADNKFFTNTYITSSGRQNYLRNYFKTADLEDPLFTSFTFDIDFVTSPLFFTINYSDYGYPNSKCVGANIKNALTTMYAANMGNGDGGYDILPSLSAVFINGDKLGFGLQQNIYMDSPLYGATEYIFMVDQRNASGAQNDVRYDSNNFVAGGGNPTASNSYKLGDSVKEVVNENDRAWAEKKRKETEEAVKRCDEIMSDPEVVYTHERNIQTYTVAKKAYENTTEILKDAEGKDVSLSEDEIEKAMQAYKNEKDSFESLKRKIISWGNGILSNLQTRGTNIYTSNPCVRKIFSYNDIDAPDKKDVYIKELEREFKNDCADIKEIREKYLFGQSDTSTSFAQQFINLYNNDFIRYGSGSSSPNEKWMKNETADANTFLLDEVKGDNKSRIRDHKIISQFKEELKRFGMIDDAGTTFLKVDGDLEPKVRVYYDNMYPDWALQVNTHLAKFADSDEDFGGRENGLQAIIADIMGAKCDYELSFDNFTSDKVKENEAILSRYMTALEQIRIKLYGMIDGVACDKSNPSPDSLYGQYLAAENAFNNDAYSQAERTKRIAEADTIEDWEHTGPLYPEYGDSDMEDSDNPDYGDSDSGDSEPSKPDYGDSDSGDSEPSKPDYGDSDSDGSDYDDSGNDENENNGNEPVTKNASESNKQEKDILAPQTVFDMLGFISGMKKMTREYPYVIQGISGLDVAYNKHYGVKDPYLGSGDDKISLTCWESLDLRVSSMFNRYFNAVYDRQYRRERVPVNLRRFNCTIYVHDVRNFFTKYRKKTAPNRIIELTDMYHSVIEFRFYDCEIVPEETGNIFNAVSNESPSEMTKTNFTFTYGNCIVNFVPSSDVAGY
jgi:hypothetical protein